MATVYNFSTTQGSQLSVRLNVKDASGDAIKRYASIQVYQQPGINDHREYRAGAESGGFSQWFSLLHAAGVGDDTIS